MCGCVFSMNELLKFPAALPFHSYFHRPILSPLFLTIPDTFLLSRYGTEAIRVAQR